ncbi:protein of unknown function [Desulfotomaculum arcticum]|uniref:DUF3870 domain-containing protein n=1 Tax=Desulfotruncus arcticus DSM 17038 TaxID=1121424 RepID=A0A1I2WMQ0_9FIRM|nr:DUF3870 domain-containing protein [Desulfotruncus arcticus]SFH02555.1 protein of unknown function [Desulfotomaculum arcticum] [Desulfotruncus arcticus DSM 17038]
MKGEGTISRTVFLAGHAVLPQGMAAKGLYEHIAIVVEIDKRYGVVIDARCTLVTDLANKVVQDLLRGYCIHDGVEEAIANVIERYHGAAKNAIIAALKDLYREYIKYKNTK